MFTPSRAHSFMTSKLAILLWATSPDAPHLCAAPFMYAATAAAIDAEVEMHFASRSVELLVNGAAERIHTGDAGSRSIHAFMQDAATAGVKFLACSDALRTHVRGERNLIPELSAVAGAASFVARVLDSEWQVLTF
jgi:predicted peroxiredoxin